MRSSLSLCTRVAAPNSGTCLALSHYYDARALPIISRARPARVAITPVVAAVSLGRRCMSSTMVGAPLRKKITTIDIQRMRSQKKPITMVTAYTYPSAVHVDAAGIDILLVGDSLAMVELGHNTTLPVTMEQMLYHCQAVARGATSPLLVGDMPFGSYESNEHQAYQNAIRFLKEGGMDCIKVEGGGPQRISTIRSLVQGGVAVMGHIGLTPQRISVIGGFRAQGRTLYAARELIEQAKQLQDAGCFSLVIECVPKEVAEAITEAVEIPTIGIGAGPYVNGQVLVYHDLLGMMQHAHHAKVAPAFAKRYGKIGEAIQSALDQYRQEVENGVFPGEAYSPYKMLKEEAAEFARVMTADRAVTAMTGPKKSTLPPLPPPPQIIEPVIDNTSAATSPLSSSSVDPHGDTIKVY